MLLVWGAAVKIGWKMVVAAMQVSLLDHPKDYQTQATVAKVEAFPHP